MSHAVFQPVTQVRLTNVAVVKVSRSGKRFEIACYRNKVVNWRNRVESDINEVLQATAIFNNVSKGVLANRKDLINAFGTDDENEIIKYILDKGELQVSDKERKAQYENLFKDVATIISEKCINPEKNIPYPSSIIESAMKEIHFSVNPNKAAKAQALELIPRLRKIMPIDRARMKLQVVTSASFYVSINESLQMMGNIFIESQSVDENEGLFIMQVDPGMYRVIDEKVQEITKGKDTHVDILEMSSLQSSQVTNDLESTMQSFDELNLSAPPESEMASTIDDKDTLDQYKKFSNDDTTTVKSAKKSKKAKRREKEEAEERKLRDELESKRVEERQKMKDEVGDETGVLLGRENAAFAESSSVSTKLKCTTCSIQFPSTILHREHFKSDWHRFNLKLKLKGVDPISEEDFQQVDADRFFYEHR